MGQILCRRRRNLPFFQRRAQTLPGSCRVAEAFEVLVSGVILVALESPFDLIALVIRQMGRS
jgi:hypothetical protein